MINDTVRRDRPAGLRAIQQAVLLVFSLLTMFPASPATIAASGSPPGVPATISRHQEDGSATPVPQELTACLLRGWIHSHEEDTEETVVYRPDEYAFPPSRGRIGFEFLAGGYLIYQAIAPADGPELMHGHWEQTTPGVIEIEIDEPEQPVKRETLEIVSCSEELLEIAR